MNNGQEYFLAVAKFHQETCTKGFQKDGADKSCLSAVRRKPVEKVRLKNRKKHSIKDGGW